MRKHTESQPKKDRARTRGTMAAIHTPLLDQSIESNGESASRLAHTVGLGLGSAGGLQDSNKSAVLLLGGGGGGSAGGGAATTKRQQMRQSNGMVISNQIPGGGTPPPTSTETTTAAAVSTSQKLFGCVIVLSTAILVGANIAQLQSAGEIDQSGVWPNATSFAAVLAVPIWVVHQLWFDKLPDGTTRPAGSIPWPASNFIFRRIFGCVRRDADTDDPTQWHLAILAPPTFLHVLHTTTTFGTTAILTALDTNRTALNRILSSLFWVAWGITCQWAAYQGRRVLIGVFQGSLFEKCFTIAKYIGISLFTAIIFGVFKLLIWYYETKPARDAALAQEYAVSDGDIVFPHWCLVISITWTGIWYGVCDALQIVKSKSSVDTSTLAKTMPLQVILVGYIWFATAVPFIWADGAVALGARRYQFGDGSPCDATCPDSTASFSPALCAATLGMQFLASGTCSPSQMWWPVPVLWFTLMCLLAFDCRCQESFNIKLRLPKGKKYHFFICHHQSSGGNQARILYDQLTSLGCKVWYDNEQQATERNLDGMRRGVQSSRTLLIFLSGRFETNGEPDKNGDYEGPFTRWFCHEEMAAARKHGLTIIGVKEDDPRFGAPNFALEKQRALTGGRGGGPVNEHAEDNVVLLDQVCFINRRTQKHEIKGYLDEIVRQGIEEASHACVSHDHEAAANVQPTTGIFDLDLPAGKSSHFCVCCPQPFGADENQAVALLRHLTDKGCVVHYLESAGGQSSGEMERVIRESTCLLLYLSIDKMEQGRLFSNEFCHWQMKIAQEAGLLVIGVHQDGFGRADFEAEKHHCRMLELSESNLRLLDQVCFVPARTQKHEVQAYVDEVLSQWTKHLLQAS
eukprot:COSAG01_NODE_415_length_17322_cov_14.785926_3_plen_857_part_00